MNRGMVVGALIMLVGYTAIGVSALLWKAFVE